MDKIKSNTCFYSEVQEYNIKVPYYQRDYAQGRIDGGRIDNIRKVFVEELFQALTNEAAPCHLGLVFGSYDDTYKVFIAVDGQQRLTTVFLLHWYIVWREKKLSEYKNLLEKFSWDTRSYSSQFVDLLFRIPSNNSVEGAIKSHCDYFSVWENDPTVKGMITMLKEIESQYPNSQSCMCKKLFSDNCNIKYDVLKLDKNSDGKTYLKMNSRGRSLTTFELFKSKFLSKYRPSFDTKFDNEWLSFILEITKTSDGSFVEPDFAFMNFINEYTYMQLKSISSDKDDETDNCKEFVNAKITNNLTDTPFISFEKYQNAFDNKLDSFERFFDWIAYNYETIKSIDNEYRFKDSRFFIDAIFKDNNPYYSHRTKLYAAFNYAKLSEYNSLDKTLYKRWTRVFRNLVANSDIDGKNFGRICKSINQIDNVDIYSYFGRRTLTAFDGAQVQEEIAKAKQIIDENGVLCKYDGCCKKTDKSSYQSWEEIINEAEKYAFFKGSIRFLFQDAWNDFEIKWLKAQNYFDEKGIKDDYKVDLTEALVVQCNNWSEQLYDKQIFNPNASTWKWILCSTIWKMPINNILLTDLKNIQRSQSLNDDNVNKNITPILDNLPFKTFVKEEPTGRFRWFDRRLTYYKPYGRRFITFDWNDFPRNKILRELKNNIYIDKTNNPEINNSSLSFWWGWDINFKYNDNNNEYYFRWLASPDEKTELDVYLMGDNWKEYELRSEEGDRNTDGIKTDEDTYYCFRVEDKMTREQFLKKLDDLIKEHNNSASK